MGRKKKRPVIKPFCYYCDRIFDDEETLTTHQKAKHFRCSECGKRLSSLKSLTLHREGVHKSALDVVPNAIKGRESVNVEVYGMSGVPEAILTTKFGLQKSPGQPQEEPDLKRLKVDSAPVNDPELVDDGQEFRILFDDELSMEEKRVQASLEHSS